MKHCIADSFFVVFFFNREREVLFILDLTVKDLH